MPKMIFVNLPVANLSKSFEFYEQIGAKNNPQFTDDTAACMVISDTIFVMLLTHEKFNSFTSRAISDAHKSAQMILALSEDSKEDVDARVKASSSLGTADPNPKQDLGFMYSRSFADPDGHLWEVLWMDPQAVQGGDASQD